MRNPLGKSPPFAVCKCISSTYITEAVRSMLVSLREKESIVFGKTSQQKRIVCDFSKVLIGAVLFDFNGETIQQYLTRAFNIVTGKASELEITKRWFMYALPTL